MPWAGENVLVISLLPNVNSAVLISNRRSFDRPGRGSVDHHIEGASIADCGNFDRPTAGEKEEGGKS